MIGWAIDRDHLADPGESTRVGYGQREPEVQQTSANYESFRRTVEVATGLKAADVENPVRFRVLDDDGEVYYGGAISRAWLEGEEEFAFAPLTFATADAGATDLQYHDADGAWTTL